jgi:hypothetical protein
MRCPDCAKMVSFDELRTDEVDIDLSDTILTMSGTVYRPCAECGTDLKSAEVEGTADVESAFSNDGLPEDCTIEYEIDGDPDIAASERSQTTDRHGNPIKNSRYMKMFYGVEASVTIKRIVKDKEGEEIQDHEALADVSMAWECQASGFEECC